MSASDYAEAKIRDHMLGTTAWTMPTSTKVSIHSADPTDTGAVGEASGSGYARQTAAWTAGANTAELDWTMPAGTWTYFAVWDQAGNCLASGPLTAGKTTAAGDTLRAAAGALVVTVS